MTQPAAFRATFSDMKLVKTRQVAQLIFEIPLADFDAAYEILGGLPNSAAERWFGIAALKSGKEAMSDSSRSLEPHNTQPQPDSPRSAGAKRPWEDFQPAQQAGIRSNDVRFEQFLEEEYPAYWRELKDAADCIRAICGVHSRTELGTDHAKRVIWHQLDKHFQAWDARVRMNA